MRTTTYYDSLGNPPNMCILSFLTPTTISGYAYIRIYKRVSASDPSQDVLVETKILPNAITDWYPYYHVLYNGENGASYVVTYVNGEGTEAFTAANRIVTENYFPPIPKQDNVILNMQRIGGEFLRRIYIVLERDGERAILLRKKRSGTRCRCWRSQDQKALPRCEYCYGVGWEGGYDVFYPFLIDFQPAGERISIGQFGLAVDTQNRGWGCIGPELYDGDFVVRLWDRSPDRYEINNPTREGKDGAAGIPVIQEFSFRLHNRDHSIYDFPVEDSVDSYIPPDKFFAIPDRI